MLKRKRGVPRRRPISMLGSHLQVSWAREIYRRLLENHVRVRETCDVLALFTPDMTGSQLAEWYLDHLIRHQRKAEWWIIHRNELHTAWFVSAYLHDHLGSHVEPPAEPLLASAVWQEALLCPEHASQPGAVTLNVEADPANPRHGICTLRYEAQSCFIHLARTLEFSWDAAARCFRRLIDECAQPLEERAAEIGSRLLLNGFRVFVLDEHIRARICSGDFGWAHGRWIDVGSTPSYLRLTFPRDKQLFHLARTLGAFWNGTQIEIGVWHTPALQDFARLYDFRITPEAARRLEEWQQLCLRGRVVTPAAPPDSPPASDPLKRILETDDAIPEDLIDED